ncbi:hypothetical protein MRX96_043394 [Rhipicephalus microplus]
MVDDMSIKKHVQLVGNKVFGYVNLGMEMPDDSLPEARNACVFMLVALNMRLKGKGGGYNNNPTACQFRAAYKRLLFHTEVTSSDAGNCCRDVLSILNMSSAVSLAESPTAVTSHRRSSLLEPVDDEHDYTHRVDLPQSLSAVTSAVVPYIAGFVARKLRSVTNCEECCAALESSEEPDLVRAKKQRRMNQENCNKNVRTLLTREIIFKNL